MLIRKQVGIIGAIAATLALAGASSTGGGGPSNHGRRGRELAGGARLGRAGDTIILEAGRRSSAP